MKVIIIILQVILNLVRKRRDLIANRSKIPPEYRDDVVVWYSPKKQRLTNYDVIESYAEDFTKGSVYNENGEISIDSEKQLTITNIINIRRGLYNIVVKNVNPDFILYVKGMASDGYLRAGGALKTGEYSFVDLHNGINKIDVSNFVIFIVEGNIAGDCNITITQLPTSILKDFSGNGLDAYMYGFQGKLNSGVGIYAVDFTTYNKSSVVTDVSHNTVKVVPVESNYLFIRYATTELPAYTINVQNLGNNVLTYQYATENRRREITLTEGINEIPESIKVDNPYQVGLRVNAGTGEITITQIPDYPNQLCYSGKEYCKAYGLPILDDYTIIARRIWFDKTNIRCLCSKYKDTTVKPGLFRFEWTVNNSEYTSSLGKDTSVTFSDDITWQTKTSYNGEALINLQYEDGEHLIIGDYAETIGNYYIGCHDDIIILKRSLTINEINDITEAIFNETIIEE